MYYHTLGKLLFMDIRDNKEALVGGGLFSAAFLVLFSLLVLFCFTKKYPTRPCQWKSDPWAASYK